MIRRCCLLLVLALSVPVPLWGQANPPNFVVILTDDQRFDSLWAMPITQQELGTRGITFTQALATTPLCCPFRASFLSGGYLAHRTGVVENAPPNGGAPGFVDGDTIATRLQAAGYATGMFGKYMNHYAAIAPYIPPGWTEFQGATSSTLAPPSFSVAVGSSGALPSVGVLENKTQYGTDYLRDQALAFIDTNAADPFFLLLSVDAPHVPAIPAPGDEALFPGYLYRDRGYGEADLSDKPLVVQILAGLFPGEAAAADVLHREQLQTLVAVDRAVGDIVDRLTLHGILDDTVVVFTSDNGFMWGEHGVTLKGWIYEESILVPLIVAAPGVVPGVDARQVAVNLDLPATILELAGLPTVGDGESLVPVLDGTVTDWRDTILIEHWAVQESWAGLRIDDVRGRWKYAEHTRGAVELYDLDADPFELDNLASEPSQATFVAQLAAELAPQKGLASTTHSVPQGDVGVPYFRALGAWGGTAPYTWSLEQGPLPPGIALAPNGSLSGTPTTSGSWPLVLRVEDASTNTISGGPQAYRQRLTLTIRGDCADGIDNDGDGLIDVAGDPGCDSALDGSEQSAALPCDNGTDDDGDFLTDLEDPGCGSPTWATESPACSDGIDNDGDGGIDYDGAPPDWHCTEAWQSREAPRCGLGYELGFLVPLLSWSRRFARRSL